MPSCRFNREKAAFLAASAWLLLLGAMYSFVPEVRRWGPPGTSNAPPGEESLDVGALASEDECLLLAGARNPFRYPKEAPGERDRSGEADSRRETGRDVDSSGESGLEEDGPGTGLADRARGHGISEVGTMSVRDKDGLIIFRDEDTGRYFAARREGDVLPGLGMKVVGISRGAVVVEKEGQRFRLTDALRARMTSTREARDAGKEASEEK